MIVLKSDAEIAKIRAAGRLAAEVGEMLKQRIAVGVTTADLDRWADAMIRDAGAYPSFKGYRGFPASICTSVNEVVVHGIPGPRVIREGDIVSVDLGAKLMGYHGDTAFTVAVGAVPEAVRLLLEVTQRALDRGIAQAVPGRRVSDISHAVEAEVAPHGFGIVRDFVGHAVGRSLHEDPQVPNYGEPGQGPRLRRGMVLAIEPMINLGTQGVRVLKDGWTVVTLDGKPSVHFEHTVAVDDPPRRLTLPGDGDG